MVEANNNDSEKNHGGGRGKASWVVIRTCLVALLPKGNERERVMKPKGDDCAALAVKCEHVRDLNYA